MTSPDPLLNLADRCVKCGLCLPHCPTYALSRDENESPRGRIAIIQGVASGQLDAGTRAWSHIERCLGCRACETACPSGVEYGRLLDGVRARHADSLGPLRSGLTRLGLAALARAPTWPLSAPLLNALRSSGLVGVARRLGPPALARMLGLLPPARVNESWRPRYPPIGSVRGRAALFLGCVSRLVEQEALLAAVRVLNRLGIEVEVPAGQVCCGAMHAHAGRPGVAARLATANRKAFSGIGAHPVVSVASACAAHLADIAHTAGTAALPGEPIEICTLLARSHWPEDLRIRAMTGRALVHEPCTQRNVLADTESPYRVLARIPGLEVLPLPGNDRCCGAAGTYVLTQPDNADRLVEAKIRSLRALSPRWLLTSNTGCALHLRTAAARAGIEVEVLHPVQLMDRALSEQPV